MVRKYFGTDGVRGKVGQFPITPDFILKLGYAVGRILAEYGNQHKPTVLIGKDTRISCYMLEGALIAGFSAAGVDIVQTGPLPTPAVAYLTRSLRLSAGVMISASHNVYSDNGIKFFDQDGSKLSDEVELRIEAELAEDINTLPSHKLGSVRRINSGDERYIEFCKSTVPAGFNLHGLKLVVDSAHGAAYAVASKVFRELGAEVVSIGNQPDGCNINEQYGATHPETLQAAVRQYKADYGIALDGDGDRLIMADENGKIYNGDYLIYTIAKAYIHRGLKIGGVVGTVMTNMAMELALQEQGIAFYRTEVGDRYVLEQLHQRGWLIGGEASGHILCMDKHNTSDGIIAALQVFAALRTLKQDLTAVCSDWQAFPQTIINVRIAQDFNWQASLKQELADVEKELQGIGRIVVRASGTEPVVRVMAEAHCAKQAKSSARRIAEAIGKIGKK